MDILIQDHSNDKYSQLLMDNDAILHSLNNPTPFFMKKSGLRLTEAPKDEAWHSVVCMELANNKLSELPLSPSSQELKVLMLQGNVDLTRIPNMFFHKMPLLLILNLSYTSVRELPDSLFELEQLRELYLKGCECFMKLSPKIGKLKNLEKLDLDGTYILHLPEEMQEVTNLQSLFLCFYEYRGRKGKQYTSSTIIPSKVISKLKELKHLSIDVNPNDERWYENVRDILPEILGLEQLLSLSLYIPHLELLEFIPDRIFQVDFRFIVGRHMQRIISSTPSTCEEKFKQSGCSLKFVNGDDVPNEIKRLVRHSKALFLERHRTIKNMSEFKMMNLEQLRVCMLAECKEMQTVVDGRRSDRGYDIFSHLLYLYVAHMKSIRSIWEGSVPPRCFLGMLKSLVLQNCAELTTVFTMDFLGNLSLLKVLIIKDCPKVTTLISDGSFIHKIEVFLPKLRKILLLHLPELINISNGCCIGPSLNKIAIYDCPKLQSLSKWELSSQSLKVIQGEMKWWDQLQWREEWGILQRPSRFDHIFSSIDNKVDIMTQIGNDGDDIDDDDDDDDAADMYPPQTLLEHPKHDADSFGSVKQIVKRITFRVKSEVDIVDDGYRWVKYGQRTKDGSKNTRYFYKCRYEGCPVRKRVQRSEEDPTNVEISYEGIHTHSSPQYNRSLHEPQSMEEPVRSSNDEVCKDKKDSQKRGVIPTGTEQSDESIEDGYSWRKYGQKEILGAKFSRQYFICTDINNEGCQATKQVQRDDKDPFIYNITYHGRHTCTQTSTVPNSSMNNQLNLSTRSGVDDNDDDVCNISALKYKALRPSSLSIMSAGKQIARRSNRKKDEAEEKTMMVPAVQFGNTEVPPEDGYTWRKYGQKEIFGSIYPRSYYRCTHQKLYQCPAKKQVQRLDSNPNIFAVTYRGSHVCHMSSTVPSSSVPQQLILGEICKIDSSDEILDTCNEKVDKDWSSMHNDFDFEQIMRPHPPNGLFENC